MEFFQLLEQRSSCRSYQRKSVEESSVQKILSAGSKIPTPSNAKQIEIIRCSETELEIVKNRMGSGYETALLKWEKQEAAKKVRNRIRNYYRFSNFMFEAPELFIITAKERKSISDLFLENGIIEEKKIDEDAITAGISLMSMTLTAEAFGLKSCILTAPLFYLENPKIGGNRILAFFCFGYEQDITPTAKI